MPAAAQGPEVTVFAAASLTDSLKQVADAYKARTGAAVTLSFGASSTLARQIEQGAAADIFFSADTDWMDYLEKAGHIAPGTRKDLLGNQLVLVAAQRRQARAADRARLRSRRRAGQWQAGHGRSRFGAGRKIRQGGADRAGRLGQVAAKVVQAENVRVALEYVARGEAPFGIVYATDAKVAPVKVVGTFPENSHPPIIYPVALTKTRVTGGARFSDVSGRARGARDFRKGGLHLCASVCIRPKRHRAFPEG